MITDTDFETLSAKFDASAPAEVLDFPLLSFEGTVFNMRADIYADVPTPGGLEGERSYVQVGTFSSKQKVGLGRREGCCVHRVAFFRSVLRAVPACCLVSLPSTGNDRLCDCKRIYEQRPRLRCTQVHSSASG